MTAPLRLVEPLPTPSDRRVRWLAFATQAALDEQRYDGYAALFRTMARGMPEGSLDRTYLSEQANGYAVLAETARDALTTAREYADAQDYAGEGA